ncbi:MAG: methylated-DNA--[protein]-cysteine S-methyltransferase [Oleibacter sp.]|nr:methylated-DNA--[protein]-cysteine S-methyltransferase [Thalassolituus sp.]
MLGKAVLSLQVNFGLSSLGLVMVAESDGEVCAVFLGDNKENLVDELATSFPNVILHVNQSGAPSKLLTRVVNCIECPDTPINDLPLHFLGSSFQCEVWQALREVAAGEVITYAQLAANIGRPSAFRAVANACGANKISVLIPCHRVVRSNGELGGYRWGTARKKKLLVREGEFKEFALNHVCG